MANLIDVAKYILDTYKSTTGIKLHKLLYYCQLNHYLTHNKPLITDDTDFTLKDNGIICNSLYNKISELVSGNPNRLSNDEILSINATLNKYAKYTIHELTDLNKREIPIGTPISFPAIIDLYVSSSTTTNHSTN
jgi:uncharacterized phage-associated protein